MNTQIKTVEYKTLQLLQQLRKIESHNMYTTQYNVQIVHSTSINLHLSIQQTYNRRTVMQLI